MLIAAIAVRPHTRRVRYDQRNACIRPGLQVGSRTLYLSDLRRNDLWNAPELNGGCLGSLSIRLYCSHVGSSYGLVRWPGCLEGTCYYVPSQ